MFFLKLSGKCFTTIEQLNKLTQAIFVRVNFEGSFFVLTNEFGNTFEDLNEAIDFVRNNKSFSSKQVELTNFNQAGLGNATWDNL